MRFIIDAHLPPRLASCFQAIDVIHTSELKDGNDTPDQDINELSIKGKYAVITKDSDFYYSLFGNRQAL